MSATFYRRLMSHRSFRAFYISLRSNWHTGLKLKTNSTPTNVSSAFHWSFDNIMITFEWRTNKRHPSGVFHISLKSTVCTTAQLENYASLPRAPSLDRKKKYCLLRTREQLFLKKKWNDKNYKLTSISRLRTRPHQTNSQLFWPIK